MRTKREIYEPAIIPLLQPDLFTGKLVQPLQVLPKWQA
jgi:hypothetical protein